MNLPFVHSMSYQDPNALFEACCEEGKLYHEDGCVVFDCLKHMIVYIVDGRVVSARSRGSRS